MTFEDHFSGHAEAYARARPTYPDALFDWLAARAPGRERAVDCATGSGQAAAALASRFGEVVATDASEAQLAHAVVRPGVRYVVALAEALPLPDASADLVTVAQAAHWFDLPRFFAEAARVLRPGGVLALWGYGLMRVADGLDAVLDVFDRDVVGPWWPPERRLIDARYASVVPPADAFAPLDAPAFDMTVDWDLDGLLAYLATWSSVQRRRKDTARPGEDPMAWARRELGAAWGDPAVRRTVRWPLFLQVGRKLERPTGA